jgi:hypothetical protein
VEIATVVLLHSPLVTAATWGELPDALRAHGYDVVVVDVVDDDEPPYAATYIARAAQQVARAAPRSPLGLVGHSGAGPLLPQIGYAQRAAQRQVGAYVFLDATLPRPGASRLELLHADSENLAHRIHDQLERGELVPAWTDDDLAAGGLGAPERRVVLAALRPRGLAFFEEPLPHPGDWPDAPSGYLQTSPAYESAARVAELRGFSVSSAAGGHFAALAQPEVIADALTELVTRL